MRFPNFSTLFKTLISKCKLSLWSYRFDKETEDSYRWFYNVTENDYRLSSFDELEKIDRSDRERTKDTSRSRTPMFLKKDRIEDAYTKHINR